ncbi:GATA zinc finger domain-containing protein 4 [Sergentomyia squamirostris]
MRSIYRAHLRTPYYIAHRIHTKWSNFILHRRTKNPVTTRNLISFGIVLALLNGERVWAQVRGSDDYLSSESASDGGGSSKSSTDVNRTVNGGGGGSSGGEIIPMQRMGTTHEPTCEELRAMWRFSKRQSRAAEITNEIPTYRDPFAFNVWEPLMFPKTRSVGGMRVSRYRDANRPVYGRVVTKEPLAQYRAMAARNRMMDNIAKYYGAESRVKTGAAARKYANSQTRRPLVVFNNADDEMGKGYEGTPKDMISGGTMPNSPIPQRGSFQRLKELVWTQRARELAQQRRTEELAARAAVLKEIANGQSHSITSTYQKSSMANLDDDSNQRLDYDQGIPVVRQSQENPLAASGYLIGGQPRSHFRERNRAIMRQVSNSYR